MARLSVRILAMLVVIMMLWSPVLPAIGGDSPEGDDTHPTSTSPPSPAAP